MTFEAALAAHESGRWQEAEALYRAMLQQEEHAAAMGNLGALLTQRGSAEEAFRFLQRAVSLEPGRAAHWANLGIAACALGRAGEGIAAFLRAEQLEPDRAVHPFNRGRAHALRGDHALAAEAAQRAVQLDPTHAGAHYNLALALLRLGRWREAWPHYEARFAMPEGPRDPHPDLPWWRGEPLSGALLLFADQGFGDTLMMARFLPALMAQGFDLILQAEPILHGLLQASFPTLRMISPGPLPSGIVAKAALLSLPGLFQVEPSRLPAQVPYLHPPATRVASVEAFFSALPPGPTIALTWQGNPAHLQDRQRSMDPALFTPLAKIPGVQWLAFTPGAEALPPLPGLRDLGAVVRDFGDSAEALQHVDLLISVDSAPAHLAGALGRPGLVLLPFVPDWRWMTDRQDTPWYPTLELRRQDRPGDWASLVEKLVLELA